MNLRPITIGFDVSQTGTQKAGCGYFADAAIRALCRMDDINRYVLYPHFGTSYWDWDGLRKTVRIDRPNVRRIVTGSKREQSYRFWSCLPPDAEQRLGDPDIVHANNFSCPAGLKNARTVYSLYDMSFLDRPDLTTETIRSQCFAGAFNAAIAADLIVAISNYTRERFLHYFFHYPQERVRVIHPGNRFESQSGQAAGRKPGLKVDSDRFWLTVGTLEPRKNLIALLEAYRIYRRRNPATAPLVIAGGQGWMKENIKEILRDLELSFSVYLTGYVSDAELAWLYRNCRGFIYPSLYEGFGLPLLEAMFFGAAAISSKATSLPEVGGEAVCYIDPDSRESISRALEALDNDSNFRKKLQQRARKRSHQYSWQNTAGQLLEAYREAIQMPKYLPLN